MDDHGGKLLAHVEVYDIICNVHSSISYAGHDARLLFGTAFGSAREWVLARLQDRDCFPANCGPGGGVWPHRQPEAPEGAVPPPGNGGVLGRGEPKALGRLPELVPDIWYSYSQGLVKACMAPIGPECAAQRTHHCLDSTIQISIQGCGSWALPCGWSKQRAGARCL